MFFIWPEINPVKHFISLDVELPELFLICQADMKVRPCSLNSEILVFLYSIFQPYRKLINCQ